MTAAHDIIQSVLRQHPELSVLSEGVAIAPGSPFDAPFRVPSADAMEISPAALRSGPGVAVHLRHALEIALWHRLAPAPRPAMLDVAVAGLACWTALQYFTSLTGTQEASALGALPVWIRQLHRFTQERDLEGDAASVAAELATIGGCLLHLQRPASAAGIYVDRGVNAEAAALIAELLDAARPAERLLTIGGDSRICLDPVSRVNKYGCRAIPAAAPVAFSSCTASTPSVWAYRAAEDERQRLLQAAVAGAPLRAVFGASMDDVRNAIAAAIGVDRIGADVVLAASGTDCELHALHLALAGDDAPVVSIVIGPDEVGSGSVNAAAGRHFDKQLPFGSPGNPGHPVAGFPVHRIRVETVPVRDAQGRPVTLDQLDAQVAALAHRAAASGARVLLHVLDGSKTGLRAPSVAAVQRLRQELGESIVVLVDAAQMRTPFDTLAGYVRSGWLVMISGSKFFMGPAFCGALLVPAEVARRHALDAAIPAGLADYLSAYEVPRTWRGWRAALPARANLGLLLRWRAALAEIESFQAAGNERQRARLAALAGRIRAELRTRRTLRPVRGPEAAAADIADSIWTFVLLRSPVSAEDGVFDYDEAWQAYVLLNRDLSSTLPAQATAAERQAAAARCHVGQPVRLRWSDGREAGGLRIALGARSLQADENDVARVFDKLEVMQRYWPQLTARPAVA